MHEAPDAETAAKISLISTAEGAAAAESWTLIPYNRFLELAKQVKPGSFVSSRIVLANDNTVHVRCDMTSAFEKIPPSPPLSKGGGGGISPKGGEEGISPGCR